jgi:hypothetical protein
VLDGERVPPEAHLRVARLRQAVNLVHLRQLVGVQALRDRELLQERDCRDTNSNPFSACGLCVPCVMRAECGEWYRSEAWTSPRCRRR